MSDSKITNSSETSIKNLNYRAQLFSLKGGSLDLDRVRKRLPASGLRLGINADVNYILLTKVFCGYYYFI